MATTLDISWQDRFGKSDHEYLRMFDRCNVEQRLLSKVEVCPDTMCWNFMGVRNNCGYGRISIGPRGLRKMMLAHRVSYMLYSDDVLEDDKVIAHRCDNPQCCNPEHLFKCTQQENMNDKIAKGRHLSNGGKF